jgi:DNA-binding transcriptional LysR family regulator
MNLRFVEAYHWAVTLKSVTRAAEKLHVTQSALSSRIAVLEEELGVLLLDRRDKQFRLTSAGVRFARHAERLLNLQRDIKLEFGAGPATRAVSLRVGVIESVLHSWLIDWLRALRNQHPGLELELTVETTPVLLDHMRRGAADLIVAALPSEAEGTRSRALASMPMVFVGQAKRHTRRRYRLAELAQSDELLTFQRGSQPHVALLDLCRKHAIEAPRMHAISSISAMVQLVESGFGVATLPHAAVSRLALPLGLKALNCEAPLTPLPIHLSWRDDPGSPVAGPVLESVLQFNRQPPTSRKSMKA